MECESDDVYLIGRRMEKLPLLRIPTNRQVLALYHHKRSSSSNLTIREISTSVIEQVYTRWGDAGLSVRQKYNSINKFEQLHQQWTQLKKAEYYGRKQPAKKLENFVMNLDKLFDVSCQNADTSPERLEELIKPINDNGNNTLKFIICSKIVQPLKFFLSYE